MPPSARIPVSIPVLAHLTVPVKVGSQDNAETERRVVEGLRKSEPWALDELTAAYSHRVARLIYRLSGWSEQKDLIQDVFVQAVQSITRFDGRSSLWTWLATITTNTCRAHRRKELARSVLWKRWAKQRQATNVGSPYQRAELREDIRQMIDSLRRLKPMYREVLVLRFLEEIEPHEIARMLGLSKSALEVRMHRAKQMLREKMKG